MECGETGWCVCVCVCGGGDAECCFTSTATLGLLGTGAQDGHLDSHTAPEFGGWRGKGGGG